MKLSFHHLHNIGKENIGLSSITEAELLYGALNSQELRKLQKHLAMCKQHCEQFRIIHIEHKRF